MFKGIHNPKGNSNQAYGTFVMMRIFQLLAMLARENLTACNLDRKPEESLVMNGTENVAAWHSLGADDGPIVPVYHFQALACSFFATQNSTVVDLGCGSGRFAAYLARLRPDLRIVGFDLSAPMVETGNASLKAQGLAPRVELRQGDMTSFSHAIPDGTSLINCLFAIHHLPGLQQVEQCLTEIRIASERTSCGFLVFDLVRPRSLKTALDYPEVFSPDAAEAFKLDSTNSLIAAYSWTELSNAMHSIFADSVSSRLAHWLPLYQAFWRQGIPRGMKDNPPNSNTLNASDQNDLPPAARRQYRALCRILPGVPGH